MRKDLERQRDSKNEILSGLESSLAITRAELKALAEESGFKVNNFESLQQDLDAARSDCESVQTRYTAREDMIKDLEYINLELKDTVSVRTVGLTHQKLQSENELAKRERLNANESKHQEIVRLLSLNREMEKTQHVQDVIHSSLQNEVNESQVAAADWSEKYEKLSQKAQESLQSLSEDCSAKAVLISSHESKILEIELELQKQLKIVPSHGAEDLKRIKELESLLRNKEFEFEQVQSDLELRAEEYIDELARWKEECDQLTVTTTEQEYETKKRTEEMRQLKCIKEECVKERDSALSDLSVSNRQLLEKVYFPDLTKQKGVDTELLDEQKQNQLLKQIIDSLSHDLKQASESSRVYGEQQTNVSTIEAEKEHLKFEFQRLYKKLTNGF